MPTTPPTRKTTTRIPPTQNVRHALDSAAVRTQVDTRIAEHEANRIRFKERAQQTLADYAKAVLDGTAGRWARVPEGDGFVDPMIDEWVVRERTQYALVRVVELPQPGKRFVLVYGDAVDAEVTRGPGPFESFDAAAGWFLRGGR